MREGVPPGGTDLSGYTAKNIGIIGVRCDEDHYWVRQGHPVLRAMERYPLVEGETARHGDAMWHRVSATIFRRSMEEVRQVLAFVASDQA